MLLRLCMLVLGMIVSETAIAAKSLESQKVEIQMSTAFISNDKIKDQVDAKIRTEFGQEIVIPTNKQNPYEFHVVANQVNHRGEDSVEVKAKIFEIKNGQAQLVSTPRIISKFGEEGSITMTNGEGESFEIRMIPRLVN